MVDNAKVVSADVVADNGDPRDRHRSDAQLACRRRGPGQFLALARGLLYTSLSDDQTEPFQLPAAHCRLRPTIVV